MRSHPGQPGPWSLWGGRIGAGFGYNINMSVGPLKSLPGLNTQILHIKKGQRINDEVSQTLLACAIHFTFMGCYGHSLNASLAQTMTCGGQPMDQPVIYAFQTNLGPIRRLRTDGRLIWPRRKILVKDLESGARGRWCPLRLRYHALVPRQRVECVAHLTEGFTNAKHRPLSSREKIRFLKETFFVCWSFCCLFLQLLKFTGILLFSMHLPIYLINSKISVNPAAFGKWSTQWLTVL